MSIAESIEMFGMISQMIPDPAMQYKFLSRIKWDNMPKEIVEGTNAPDTMLEDEKKAQQAADQFAQGMAADAEAERAVKMADAAAKGSQPIEPNSPTSLALGVQ